MITPEGGVPPYRFTINGNSYQAISSFTGLEGGSYIVSTLDVNQCEFVSTLTLDTPYQVQVDLGSDLTILPGSPVQLFAMVNIPADSLAIVTWIGIDNTSCPQCLVQTVAPIETTTYTIEVVDWDGCIATDSLTIFVSIDNEVFVPNIFSPNDDQINDQLIINGGKKIESIQSFEIFDRWGNLVFEAKEFHPGDPQFAWDGTFNGKPVNPGVFVYRMMLEDQNGNPIVKYGNVTVVK
jgi:gliding motility-associated-like protein